MYYTFFNNEVKFLNKNNKWCENYKKSKDPLYVAHLDSGNLTYKELRYRLLPKPLRRTQRDAYWLVTSTGQLLVHSYSGYTPKVLCTRELGTETVPLNELSKRDHVLTYSERGEYVPSEVSSVQLLKNFNVKSYLSNYVAHVPQNTSLLVNGFFVVG